MVTNRKQMSSFTGPYAAVLGVLGCPAKLLSESLPPAETEYVKRAHGRHSQVPYHLVGHKKRVYGGEKGVQCHSQQLFTASNKHIKEGSVNIFNTRHSTGRQLEVGCHSEALSFCRWASIRCRAANIICAFRSRKLASRFSAVSSHFAFPPSSMTSGVKFAPSKRSCRL